MSTGLILQIKSTSSESTEQLGRILGANCRGGELIELKSDLGGGKTTFTRGFAEGTGSTDDVASPTFTISKVYNAPSFTIHHFDFYRLPEPGIISLELQEIISDPTVVIVVEWGDIVADVLPEVHVTISFVQIGESEREITISIPGNYAYLAEGLQP
jgi:tRNA threonylcarbamoyladenosine biosynthesis protein TsaE